ncbi:biotin synthase BioB [Sodalis-like secondary symbiont of Drepanosiphum platanoidis]|uniref:biotin synthase BioB n=1 Tax=Sodalis-like secondary symbiont of Drepanosiphum platanoidis TaxID=2994493 RepID=UPI0034644955
MSTIKTWTFSQTSNLFKKPFFDLLFKAQKIHRKNFTPNKVQISTLLSIKTGSCPEDCKYCPQSSRHKTNLKTEKLIDIETVLKKARIAKKSGSTRFCMGAAWKNPKNKDIPILKEMIKKVKSLGLETCMTLGMLDSTQANQLSEAGLDYYNHNLDTSPEYYSSIISTRTYQDRLDTIKNVRNSGIKVCSGGIIGLGESFNDRINLLIQLANMEKPPESIPINILVKVPGTPLSNTNIVVDSFDFIKIIAVTRIMMNSSYIRLSAGRENMNEEMQALCFMAGANSVFYGCKLLTTTNPDIEKDIKLFEKLGINTEKNILSLKEKKTKFTKNDNILNDNEKYYDAYI